LQHKQHVFVGTITTHFPANPKYGQEVKNAALNLGGGGGCSRDPGNPCPLAGRLGRRPILQPSHAAVRRRGGWCARRLLQRPHGAASRRVGCYARDPIPHSLHAFQSTTAAAESTGDTYIFPFPVAANTKLQSRAAPLLDFTLYLYHGPCPSCCPGRLDRGSRCPHASQRRPALIRRRQP
jgi:hypothetical protein